MKLILSMILIVNINIYATGSMKQTKRTYVPKSSYSTTRYKTTTTSNNCQWQKIQIKELRKENRELKRIKNRLSKENYKLRKSLSNYKKNYKNTKNIQNKYSTQTRRSRQKEIREKNNAKRNLKKQINNNNIIKVNNF